MLRLKCMNPECDYADSTNGWAPEECPECGDVVEVRPVVTTDTVTEAMYREAENDALAVAQGRAE